MPTESPLLDTHTQFRDLRRCELLTSLSEADIEELKTFSELRVVERGKSVYRAGEASSRVFVLETGSVKLSRIAPDGKEVNLAVLGPSEIFGELAITGETIRRDTAQVLEDAVVCAFELRGFCDFLRRHPDMALRVAKLIGRRLRRAEAKIQDILFNDVRTRLAHTMARLAREFGKKGPNGTRIAIRLTQTDLAQLIGSTRETTSTIFNEFRREGMVANDGPFILVPDVERLAQY